MRKKWLARWMPLLVACAAAPPTLADHTCETATHIGAIPPDHFEQVVFNPAAQASWRSFTLTSFHFLRFEVSSPPDFLLLFRNCDMSSQILGISAMVGETRCLEPDTYALALHGAPPPAVYDLRILDAGPCFPPRQLFARPSRILDLDGDEDGYADTGETVQAFLTVSNKSRFSYTNVVATVSTTDAKVACIPSAVVPIGSLAAHSETESTVPFRFQVSAGADRRGSGRTVSDDYSASFSVTLTADEVPVPVVATMALELDLNSTTAARPTTTFVEGFESGFGSFQFQNLDANRASNSLSDGYRCQYNDPDFPNSLSYGSTVCYLGLAQGQAPINDWLIHSTTAPDGGRAFLGSKSLHYGKHAHGNPAFDNYGLSQLDAIRTGSDIHLAARVCQDDPAQEKRSCNSPADCLVVGGGPCVSAHPELSFKHQVSAMNDRFFALPEGQTLDRAVVHAEVAGSTVWRKLDPFRNIYDAQGENVFTDCTFDPTDDGSQEDSYFDPTDPDRLYGPSSTCYPEFVFADLGDTDEPYDPANIGAASDGPGLEGSLGIGTWVESKFDLSRYGGRSIRIRFLFTSIKIHDFASWEDFFDSNVTSIPYDDGWYVDDVRVTQTLGNSSPTAALDDAPPPSSTDTDGDGAGDLCDSDDDNDGVTDGADCRPLHAGNWAVPGEAMGLTLNGKEPTTVSWQPPSSPGGSSVLYDVLRSGSAADFTAAACLASDTPSMQAQDDDPTTASFYLVRSENTCGGNLGFTSSGVPRAGRACP